MAVTRLETEQTEAPQKVALAFHLNRSFILAVEAVGKAVASEADGLFHAFVTISPAAFDKVHTVLIETTESANSTGQEMPSRLTISAVSSDDQDPPLPIVSAGTHDGEPKKEYPLLTEPRQPTAMPLSAALKDNGAKVLAYGPVELTHEIELVNQHPCWRALQQLVSQKTRLQNWSRLIRSCCLAMAVPSRSTRKPRETLIYSPETAAGSRCC